MPGDFRELLDLRALTDEQRGNMEFVLNSPAYADYFKPFMEGILSQMNQLWKDRSQKRKDQYPDEFLAGAVVFGEGLLKVFEMVISETNMERVHAAMENMTPELLYDMKRQRGQVRPIIGLDQPALPEPVNPAEDF